MYDISILMPSYNQGAFIKEAIDSVLDQSRVKVQLIVIDGGSTDETVEILSSYGDRLFYLSEPDEGQSAALNKALIYAKAPITGWLNSDDMYLNGSFLKILDAFASNPEIDLIHGARILIDSRSQVIGWSKPGPFNPLNGYNICSETAFWRSKCIPDLCFREDLKFAMDTHFLGSIARSKKIMYLPKYIGFFRCHAESKSSTMWEDYAIPEASKVWEELYGMKMKWTSKKTSSQLKKLIYFVDLPIASAASYLAFKLKAVIG